MPDASSILRRLIKERIKRGAGATAPLKLVDELGVEPVTPWEDKPWYGKAISLISRPMYASAGFAKGLVKGRNPFTGAWKGLTGVKETTFSDVLGDMGMQKGLGREVAGFVGDVLLDPITYLGGLSVAGKLTARGAQVQSKMVRAARGMVGKRMSRELGGKALGEVEESVAKEALRRIAKDLKIPDLYDKLVTTSPEMMAAHLAERRMTGAVARHPRFVPPRALRLAGVPVAPVSAQQAVGRGIQHLGRLAAEIPGIREVVKGGRELGVVARKAFVTTPPGPHGKEIKRIADFARESANVEKHALVEEVREMVRKMTTGVLKGKSPTQREEVIGEVTRLLQPIEKKIYNLPPEEAARELTKDLVGLRDKFARLEEKIPIEAQVAEKFAPGVPPAAPREALLKEKVALQERAKSLRKRYKKETAELRKAEAAVGKPPAKVKEQVAARLAKEPKKKAEIAARREAMKSLEVGGARASVEESKRALGDIRRQGGVYWAKIDPNTGKWTDMEEIMELPKHLRASASRVQLVKAGRIKGRPGVAIDELADEWGVSSSEAVARIQRHQEIASGAVGEAVEEALPMARKLAKKKAEARILKEMVRKESVKQRKVVRGVSGLRKETEREGLMIRSNILEVDKRLAAVKEAPIEVASKRRLAKVNKIQDRIFKHEKAIKSLPKAKDLLGEETVRSIKKVATIEDEKIEGTFEWAQELRKKLDDLHAGEKDLPVPPRYREGYFPHIMKPEYRKILHKAFLENPQRLAPYPKGAKLGSSLQRVFEGTVTEYTLDDLMRYGFINMKSAMDVLRKAGKKIPSEDLIFETNPLEVYFKRKVKSINARTNVQMQEAMIQELAPFSTTLDDWGGIKAFLKREPDHVVYVPSKDYRKILTTKQIDEIYKGDPAAALKSGIEEIRPVSKDLKKLLKQAKGKNIVAFMVPREAADHLVSMFKVIESDDAMREAGYMWDKVTGYWKTWATVPRPAFHVRNAFSNLWQNYLAGMGLRSLKYYAMAAQLHAKKGTSLKGLKGIGHFSAEDVMALAEMHGVLKGGYVGGDVLQDAGHRLFPTVWNPVSEGGLVIRGMAKLPQAYENNARLAHFLWMMDKTGDATAAAMSVKKHLFDYQDLTHFEKTVMKRIAPFYSWCVPDDSEILTRDGWKFHQGLSEGEEALTYKVETDRWEWQPVEEVARFDYSGQLMSLKNNDVDFLFTPDHRWPIWDHKDIRRVVRGYELRSSHKLIQVAGKPLEASESCLSVRDAAILGWIVTDGYIRKRKNYWEMVIYQSPKKHLKEVIGLVGSEGRANKPHPDTGVVPVRLHKVIIKRLTKVFSGKEDFPGIVSGLSTEAAEAMYDAMLKAEAHVCEYRKQIHFGQNPGPILDGFQILCAILGKAANLSKRGCYVKDRRFIKAAGALGTEWYEGTVWCPVTKNGTWVMRRKGKIVITGNTRKNIPLQAEKFITDPGKFLTLSKAQAAVERLSAGDEKVLDRKHVASWIRDANGVRIKVDKDGKHHFWLMSGWIPAADLSKFDAEEIVNMMHPLPKLIFEKSVNKDFFSGRKITRFPGEKVEFVGITMSPAVRHVLKQMVILNEIDRVSRDKGTPGQIIARTIIRTYPQDPTRALTRYVIETRAEMSRYKKDYKKAVAKHGEDAMIPRALKSQVDRLEKELEDAKKEGKRRDPKFMRWRKKQSAAPKTMQALKARASARIYSRFKEAASGH